MSRDGSIQYRRLRAPQEHGERLVEPPLREFHRTLRDNRNAAKLRDCHLQGRSIGELTAVAKAHVVDAAVRFTSRYRSVADGLNDSALSIVMTGHQPELYHPGVWIKNFVLDRIARDEQAVAINLLIDNDSIHQPAIRVPTGTVNEPTIKTVAFDESGGERPFEQRELKDQAAFNSFADRIHSSLMPALTGSLVTKLWPDAVAASRENRNLGECLSQARHGLEAFWGLKTLELPLSHVCDGDSFRWFMASILARLDEFRKIYNDSLLEYRRVNRVRSQTHPVPRLTADGEWLEAPFWIWTEADPTRRRLFVRTCNDGIEFTDRGDERHVLSLSANGSCEVAVEQLASLASQGVKLRSRALLTTMFARLFISDLFIHGIGGAKYDQLTDAIIAAYFGLTPPTFVTATATAHLPLDYPRTTAADIATLDLELRDLRFNPQRHLDSVGKAKHLVAAKRRAIDQSPKYVERQERHLQIAHLNAEMQPFVEQQRVALQKQRVDLVEQARISRLLGSREFSFCLFPESTLRPLLLDI